MKKSKRPLELRLTPSRIRLQARLAFDAECQTLLEGRPIREIILRELSRQFSSENPFFAPFVANEWDFPERSGQIIKLSARFECGKGPCIHFHYIDAKGICCLPLFPFWRPWGTKHILLFQGDIRTGALYTAHQLGKIACHEFGHAMGLGDLYGGFAPYGLCRRKPAAITAEMPANDLMRTHFRNDWFTPNDLEMALLAQQEQAPQSHYPTGWWWKGLNHVSRAIRGSAY